MFKSKQNRRVRRAVADSTQNTANGPMSLCRACLVVLRAEDQAHDLHSEKDLALKFLACTGRGLDALLPAQEEATHVVLKCICESCYQLVQKFHDFQRMCAESLENFEKLLLEAYPKQTEKEPAEAAALEQQKKQDDGSLIIMELLQELANPKGFEDIEQVYILEDESVKEAQVASFIALQHEEKVRPPIPGAGVVTRGRGQRHTLNCSLCLQRFYKSSLLEAHMEKHKGRPPYACVHCGKAYGRADSLDEHLRDVHGGSGGRSSYPCEYPDCGKIFGARRSLNYHVTRKHNEQPKSGPDDGPCICETCGKSYRNQAYLTRHQWVHASKAQRPYECAHCHQRFYTKQFLGDHMVRLHSAANLLRCTKCGRILPSRAALAEHTERAHAAASAVQWKCESCQMDFATPSTLRAHQRMVHLRLRPHACSYCDAKFAKRQHLVHHEMRHTGERAYKCAPCKRAFIQKTSYERHLREH